MADRLFEIDRTPRRKSTTTALVPTSSGVCPECGSQMERRTIDEAVLFRAAGYGATRRTVVDYCTGDRIYDEVCRWSLVRSVQEVRPA